MINENILINTLVKLKNDLCGCNQDVIDKVIEVIKMQPKVNEWIPIKERLPIKNGNYLVTLYIYFEHQNSQFYYEDNNIHEDYITTQAYYDKNQKIWKVFYDGYGIDEFICVNALADLEEMDCLNDIARKVLAWQPLPESYKGSDE